MMPFHHWRGTPPVRGCPCCHSLRICHIFFYFNIDDSCTFIFVHHPFNQDGTPTLPTRRACVRNFTYAEFWPFWKGS